MHIEILQDNMSAIIDLSLAFQLFIIGNKEIQMNPMETALELEERSRQLYLNLAQRCLTHEGIKKILLMLAADHEQHAQAFSAMKKKAASPSIKTQAFKSAKKIFTDMQNKQDTFSCDIDQLHLYEEAKKEIEKKAQFYGDMLKAMSSDENKTLLTKIIKEEEKQILFLDNIIQMVNRPNTWIEDAEFNHLDEY